MMAEKLYSVEQAHLMFAKRLNGEVWDLLEQPARSADEDERMLHAAHASCLHWLVVGSALNHQRGVWLISRVNAVLGRGEEALRYARRCLEITEAHPELMQDFDPPFAYECMARSHAVLRQSDEALQFYRLAEQAGESIADAEDREVFFNSLKSGNWHDLLGT